MDCKKEAPSILYDITLLTGIRCDLEAKTIKGAWKLIRYWDEKTYKVLRHFHKWDYGGLVFYSSFCVFNIDKSKKCSECLTPAPKHIIKYCKENNVRV